MTNSDDRREEDHLVLILDIHYKGGDEIVLVPYSNFEDLDVQDIKNSLADVFDLSEAERLGSWLVFKGRKLSSHERVGALGIEDHSKLYLGVTAGGTASSPPAAPSTTASTAGRPTIDARGSAASATALGGFTEILASNPELMLDLMQSNPKMKSLLERNPQLRHALSDPTTLKELLGASSRSAAFQEAMRGHDRALANIENLPGGFQALQQFYTKELAEVEEGLDSLRLAGRESLDFGEELRSTPKQQLTTDPMPNPWNRPAPRNSPFGAPTFSKSSLPGRPPTLGREVFDETKLQEYEIRFAVELQMMQDMGFGDRKDNVRALLATGGNVNLAIEWVINRQFHPK